MINDMIRQELKPSVLQEIMMARQEISVLRDDLIHPFISGNKSRKLKYNIEEFKQSGKKKLITFGGAFSNHLIATAAASKIFNFESIGIVRGEKILNAPIDFMEKCGMKLHFVSRNDYRLKEDPIFVEELLRSIGENPDDCFIIPEGGANEAAIRGVSELIDEIQDTDYILCACGTGTTLAGIARRLKPHQTAIGISVLKAEGYILSQVQKMNGNTDRIIVFDNYHFGGYAKSNTELDLFCKSFTAHTKIPVEPVYTGKLFYALDDLIRRNYFTNGSRITVVHTGGVFAG